MRDISTWSQLATKHSNLSPLSHGHPTLTWHKFWKCFRYSFCKLKHSYMALQLKSISNVCLCIMHTIYVIKNNYIFLTYSHKKIQIYFCDTQLTILQPDSFQMIGWIYNKVFYEFFLSPIRHFYSSRKYREIFNVGLF